MRASTVVYCLPIIVALSGCAGDPTRLMDDQVRSGDRPECQTQTARGIGAAASGVESAADPCGNLGTVPIISSDDGNP